MKTLIHFFFREGLQSNKFLLLMGACMAGSKAFRSDEAIVSKASPEQLGCIKMQINQQFSAFTFKGVTKTFQGKEIETLPDSNIYCSHSYDCNIKNTSHFQDNLNKVCSIKNIMPSQTDNKNIHSHQKVKSMRANADHMQTEESEHSAFREKYCISKSEINIKPVESDQQDYRPQFSQLNQSSSRIKILEKYYQETDNTLVKKVINQKHMLLILATLKCSEPIQLEEIAFNDGNRYKGEWKNGKRHGKGTLATSEGAIYCGNWIQNAISGEGVFCYSNKDVYRGSFLNNQAEGKGSYQQNNGTFYEGEWKAHKKDGYGKQVYGNNQFYQGEWKNGYKHGRGYLRFSDGSYCRGEFYENSIHGEAEYCWVNQKVYNGFWSLNKMQGKGKMVWNDGRSYEGNYQNDKMHGKGIMFIPNQGTFNGYWKNGKKNGSGEFVSMEGTITKGIWYEDRCVEQYM